MRFSKYDLNHSDVFPHMPSGLTWIRGSRDQLCRKPFFKSRKTTALVFPRSILYAQVSVASRRAVTVECVARKPDRYLQMILCSSK